MSGDLNQVQLQMMTNELINNMKNLSNCESSSCYVEILEKILVGFSAICLNDLAKSQKFVLNLIEVLQTVVPIFEKILSINDSTNVAFEKTSFFLGKLSQAFDGICLFQVFTRADSNERLKEIFKNYIGLMKLNYLTDARHYDNLTSCLIPLIGFSSIFISVHEKEIPQHFLSSLLDFTRKNLLSTDRSLLIKFILSLIKVFAKKNSLVQLVIESGWADSCVEWLNMINGKTIENRPDFNIDYHIYLIIQKLARHNLGVQKLSELNCLKKLEECNEKMNRSHSLADFECLSFLNCMIYSLLMESDAIKQISLVDDEKFGKVLEELVRHTIEASKTEFFSYRCFHLSEILSVFSKLFVNDDILMKCLETNKSFFDCLCQLLTHFASLKLDLKREAEPMDDEMLANLTNLLWSISFHQSFQEKFQKNTMLTHAITNLSSSASLYGSMKNRSVPSDLCSIKKAAEGILWNLKNSKKIEKNQNENQIETVEKSPMAMISYCHSDATFCRELVDRLSNHLTVWADFTQSSNGASHSDDLWEDIARSMEKATVVVMIVSKEYYDSKSCRQELCYATDTLRKRIVAVYAPYQQYRPAGWLGIRIAGQKYVHFGRKLFNDAIQELVSIIVNEQKPVESTKPIESKILPIESENEKFSTLNNWTEKDIENWLEQNQINKNLIELLAGRFKRPTALIVYARHLRYFYRHEFIRIYNKYAETFNGKMLDTFDFVTMADAFFRLRLEHDPMAMAEDKFDDQSALEKLKELENGITWF